MARSIARTRTATVANRNRREAEQAAVRRELSRGDQRLAADLF
jgi:hypothetical protein